MEHILSIKPIMANQVGYSGVTNQSVIFGLIHIENGDVYRYFSTLLRRRDPRFISFNFFSFFLYLSFFFKKNQK